MLHRLFTYGRIPLQRDVDRFLGFRVMKRLMRRARVRPHVTSGRIFLDKVPCGH